jgi:CheY-like chemotaxis protein
VWKTRNAAPKSEPAAPKTVLLIADNPELLHSLRAALSSAGYAIEIASEANTVEAKLHARRPDFIFTDLQLPGLQGLPLARSLLADPEWEAIPVIALTADPAAGDQRRELEDLFDGFCPDPPDPAELVRQLQALVATGLQPGSNPAATSSEPVPSGDPRVKADGILASLETGLPQSQFASQAPVSLQQLATALAAPENGSLPAYLGRAAYLCSAPTVRGAAGFRSAVRLCREVLSRDPDPAPAFEALRAEYLDNRTRELATLAGALRRADFPALAAAAHNLKGTGAAYGFAELTELGRALESAAKQRAALGAEVLLGKIEFYLRLVHHP